MRQESHTTLKSQTWSHRSGGVMKVVTGQAGQENSDHRDTCEAVPHCHEAFKRLNGAVFEHDICI